MHTNRKLFDLATKNSQRNAASEFVSSLPGKLKTIFEGAKVIYHPELSEFFSPIIHQSIELQKLIDLPTIGTKTMMTSSKEKALEHFFRWASELPEDEYVFVLGGGNGVSFDGTTSWVSNFPGYVLKVSDALEAYKMLSLNDFEEVAIASQNSQHAVLLETFSGFLPDDPSEDEVVYELSKW